MQDQRRKFSRRKNGSFSEENNSKKKFVLFVEDQAILQRLSKKRESNKAS